MFICGYRARLKNIAFLNSLIKWFATLRRGLGVVETKGHSLRAWDGKRAMAGQRVAPRKNENSKHLALRRCMEVPPMLVNPLYAGASLG